MSEGKGDDFIREAGENFSLALELGFEDVGQRRLRYHLLRLTAAGLNRDEVADLGELGRLAFDESDATSQTAKIKGRADASPLAVAIADLVEGAGQGLGGHASPRAVFLGAVLGAYAAVGGVMSADQTTLAILGATGGAIAAPITTVILDQIVRESASEYLSMQED